MSESYRTVRRIVAILHMVAVSSGPLRLTDIATALDIPFSSAHLLLQELTKEGMIRRAGDREYEPGLEFVALGVQITKRLKVLEVARPIMHDLMVQTTQDVFLAIPSGVGMMYIERINGPESFRLEIPLGVPRALHSTAIGQLYLAQQDPARADELIEKMDLYPATPHTVVDRSALRERIAETRLAGMAITDQESVDGIMGLAAPIFDFSDQLVGALSLSVFVTLGRVRRDEFSDNLKVACADVSRRMGWKVPAAAGPGPGNGAG